MHAVSQWVTAKDSSPCPNLHSYPSFLQRPLVGRGLPSAEALLGCLTLMGGGGNLEDTSPLCLRSQDPLAPSPSHTPFPTPIPPLPVAPRSIKLKEPLVRGSPSSESIPSFDPPDGMVPFVPRGKSKEGMSVLLQFGLFLTCGSERLKPDCSFNLDLS